MRSPPIIVDNGYVVHHVCLSAAHWQALHDIMKIVQDRNRGGPDTRERAGELLLELDHPIVQGLFLDNFTVSNTVFLAENRVRFNDFPAVALAHPQKERVYIAFTACTEK